MRLTLTPDQLMEQNEKDRVATELDKIRAALTNTELNKIREDAEALRRLQEQKDDMSCLPTLALSEIPPTVQSVRASTSPDPIPAVCYEQPTSGIFYFSAVAGSGLLPKPLLPLVPIFCHAFSKIGTSINDYIEMAKRIDAYTGGIGCSCHVRTRFDDQGTCLPFVSFNGKCLDRNQEKMFEIIEELFCQFDFSDLDRLKSLLLEYRAAMESMIIQNGHRLAMSLASRNFSTACSLSETWNGIHQLQIIKQLTDDLSSNQLNTIAEKLYNIGQHLLTSNNLKMAIIGEGSAIDIAGSSVALIQNRLDKKPEAPNAIHGFFSPEIDLVDDIPREGWGTSSAVSFVASTFQTVRLEHNDAPALSVISKMLRSLYLHREIREKGGAYCGVAIYNSENGLFHFGSYRDPHIVSTLKKYEDAQTFIASGNYSDEDVKEAILQVCSDIDKPDPPGVASRKAFYRSIVSLSDEMRNRFKNKLLALTRDKIINTAKKYFAKRDKRQAVAVISSEERLNAANEKLGDKSLKLYRI